MSETNWYPFKINLADASARRPYRIAIRVDDLNSGNDF